MALVRTSFYNKTMVLFSAFIRPILPQVHQHQSSHANFDKIMLALFTLIFDMYRTPFTGRSYSANKFITY